MFVDENIRRTAAVLDVPLNPFRTWIALHETTHAFEFEAHPWLRPYWPSGWSGSCARSRPARRS
jgi:uncharacterized protein (DUF2342 family)